MKFERLNGVFCVFREVIYIMETEYRSYNALEFRAVDNEGKKIIEGHAAVFNRQTDIGGYFFEEIDKSAFDNADLRDVPLIVNHDFTKIPLARSRRNNGNSTLTLSIDDLGLAIKAKLDVDNNADARALYSAVDRGDLSGMSFAFKVDKEEWLNLDTDTPTRRITGISKVFEVSACTFPQYESTDLQARSNTALDSAKKALENARAQSLDKDNELEILKLKNRILGGL